MNKTININLGGYAFVIDEDAYETAHHYLTTLTRHFGGSEGAIEIMQDIESRMGELINRNKGTRTIVSKLDVVDAIAILGTPEELKDIDFAEPVMKEKTRTSETFQLKTGKRLFRDPDDKYIGGVCSGLAAYFGIQDVVWVRIAFVLLTMLFGSSAIIYLVLWAIVPAAKTISDRLEMMGEPTNVNNIAKMVKEEIEEISDKLHDKFAKKNKPFSFKKKRHKQDNDQTYTSGWSLTEFQTKPAPNAPYKSKDFV
ncbi:MAG TPA: PspC domain-containing protein [Saprospiraceae bacterium]|nr:PspC domain-containing protein [Saprospiraceae bacterium]